MSFVSHIECTVCGRHHEAGRVLTVCEGCGQMLAVRYDLLRVAASVDKGALRARPPGMYRFRELTPLDAAVRSEATELAEWLQSKGARSASDPASD